MFTDLYLRTTDPETTLQKIMSENFVSILVSVIFHTLIYAIFVNLISYIFFGKWLSRRINIRLLIILILMMFFGYIGRYYNVKEVYKAYEYNKEKTRSHLDRLYIGWIFIA